MTHEIELGELGKKVRRIRQELGLTQEQLGERASLHYTYIGQVERGTKLPSLKTLKKIASALNTDLDYFLEEGDKYHVSTRHLLEKELLAVVRDRSPEEIRLIIDIIKRIFSHLDEGKHRKE